MIPLIGALIILCAALNADARPSAILPPVFDTADIMFCIAFDTRPVMPPQIVPVTVLTPFQADEINLPIPSNDALANPRIPDHAVESPDLMPFQIVLVMDLTPFQAFPITFPTAANASEALRFMFSHKLFMVFTMPPQIVLARFDIHSQIFFSPAEMVSQFFQSRIAIAMAAPIIRM